jgi:starch synthase
MKILMISAEYAPLAKAGGLGDMVAALAGVLAARGHEVKVVLPLYGDIDRERHALAPCAGLPPFAVRRGGAVRRCRFWRAPAAGGPDVLLLENDELFGRPGIYGYADVDEFADTLPRLALLAQGALEAAVLLDWAPDVVHVHDAAAALAAVDLACWSRAGTPLAATRTLLTIHNLAHQSLHPRWEFTALDLPTRLAWHPGEMEFHGGLNLMKAGILMSDLVNTVSPTYAGEVIADEETGCGLAGVLLDRGAAFSGILNGMDRDVWNPATDRCLPSTYSADSPAGKTVCRTALLRELGLQDGGPVLASVGRLARQKGIDLLLPLVDGLVDEGWRLAVLGTGEPALEQVLRAAAAAHPGRVAFADRFDEALSHRFYAGADAFVMPSRFEPCGLAQLYALRYGTPPVVRRTGGLADTVTDAAEPGGDGFVFDEATPAALGGALARAIEAWREPGRWSSLVRRGMAAVYGWDAPAAAYEDLYRSLEGT